MPAIAVAVPTASHSPAARDAPGRTPGLDGDGALVVGPAPVEVHDERVGAVERLGRFSPLDDDDAALVELLLQGEVDHLLQVPETPEVDVGHRR